MKKMLVGKEVRKDLAEAQRELEHALASDDLETVRHRVRIAKAAITDAMRRLG